MMSADVIESLLGAMYIDGGFEPCRSFVTKYWTPFLQQSNNEATLYKSILQMWLQSKENKRHPTYAIEEKTGPEHDLHFNCSVSLGEEFPLFFGTGNSKKAAEQMAAKAALDWIYGKVDTNDSTPPKASPVQIPKEILPSNNDGLFEIHSFNPQCTLYKNKLQEFLQRFPDFRPPYYLTERYGSPQFPSFHSSVTLITIIPSNHLASKNWPEFTGRGLTKKSAEQMAAQKALYWLSTQTSADWREWK